jgi:hypothetical protein
MEKLAPSAQSSRLPAFRRVIIVGGIVGAGPDGRRQKRSRIHIFIDYVKRLYQTIARVTKDFLSSNPFRWG